MVLTAYANKGIPIPIVEGVSFVDAGIQFGMVYSFKLMMYYCHVNVVHHITHAHCRVMFW